MSEYGFAHLNAVPKEARRGRQSPMALKLKVVVSHQIWVSGIELKSSTRAFSLAPQKLTETRTRRL